MNGELEVMKAMYKLAFVTWAWIALGLFGTPTVALAAEESSGEEILARITERARVFERAYLGSFSRRKATTRILDGDDGELKSTRDVVVDVWDYHGEQPINEVRQCRIDHESVDIAKCIQKRRLKPAHRLFDDEAEKHYRLAYQGIASWKGQACHQIRVIPLEQTSRHLKGDVFFRVDTLRIVGMDITLADYPFGLKDLSIELSFADQNGLPVIASGRSAAHIYVPFLINDLSVTLFSATEQRLLTERHTANAAVTGG